MTAHQGGCLCGAVRYRVTAEPQVACYCCCATCQGATGAPAVSWIAVEEAGFEIVAESPVAYESSPGVTRSFCGRCGTALTYRNPGYPDDRFQTASLVAIASITLDDPEAFPPTEVFHGDELPSWLSPHRLCPGGRHHHTGTGDDDTA